MKKPDYIITLELSRAELEKICGLLNDDANHAHWLYLKGHQRMKKYEEFVLGIRDRIYEQVIDGRATK